MSHDLTARVSNQPKRVPSRPPTELEGPSRGPGLQFKGLSYAEGLAALSPAHQPGFEQQQAALRPPVQARGKPQGQDIHAAARRGTAGSGGAVPFLAQIQASFGRHDVSAVSAHLGGGASEACASMGAEAYATGNHVVFGSSPSLHTAAHEAAHVVQQRAGVSLSGGVGQVGDSYEQHADAVADRVVQGKSAEGLLDTMAGDGAVRGVQQKVVQREGDPRVHPPRVDPSKEDLYLLQGFEKTPEQCADISSPSPELVKFLGGTDEDVEKARVGQIQAAVTSRFQEMIGSYLKWVGENLVLPDDETFQVYDKRGFDPYRYLDVYSKANPPTDNGPLSGKMYGDILKSTGWIPGAAKLMGIFCIGMGAIATMPLVVPILLGEAALTTQAAVEIAFSSRWVLDAGRMLYFEYSSLADYEYPGFPGWFRSKMRYRGDFVREWAASAGIDINRNITNAILDGWD